MIAAPCYDDRCTGSPDGQHTWVNNDPGHGSDCASCGATTAVTA